MEVMRQQARTMDKPNGTPNKRCSRQSALGGDAQLRDTDRAACG